MAITLNSFVLPEELVWIDEFSWQESVSSMKRTIGGYPIINRATRYDIRPITLSGENSWIQRDSLVTLQSMLDHSTYSLKLHDDRIFQVEWRFWDDPVLDVEQVLPIAHQTDNTYWLIRALKLVTV
jgi:hypothetical protein